LHAAIAEKTFREDLYFRISAVPITIPPLRDRGDDVFLLAEHFLERFRREFRKPALKFSEETRARLVTYAWPGNVRELQNAIERAAILANGPKSTRAPFSCPPPSHPPSSFRKECSTRNFNGKGRSKMFRSAPSLTWSASRFQNALRESKWNKTRAAEKLGVSYKTLLHKIRALGLDN